MATSLNNNPAKKNSPVEEFALDNLKKREKKKFVKYDKEFSSLKNQVGCVMAIALLFFVPSVLVILCGGLCLAIPGANVIKDVFFNAFLSGTGGMIMSIALFHKAYAPAQKKDAKRNEWISNVLNILDKKLEKPKNVKKMAFIKAGAKFVEQNLVPEGNNLYKKVFLDTLKKHYEEAKDQKGKLIVEVLNKTTENVLKARKPKPPPPVLIKNAS